MPREEWVLYGLLVVVGAIPVVLAFASGSRFDALSTIGLMMSVGGLLGLGHAWRTRRPHSARPADLASCNAGLARSCDLHASADVCSADLEASDEAAPIVIVEDEVAIRRFLRSTLTGDGFRVREAGTIADAERVILEHPPAVILLDLGLPDGDGLDLLRRIRTWCLAPVIVMSARDRARDQVEALDAGADDYVTKPFVPSELLARVRSAIRASKRLDHPILEVGTIRIDRARQVVTRDGEPIELTPIELRLLARLARTPGKVVTHNQLTSELRRAPHPSSSTPLRVHVATLRRKLETDPARPRWLLTEAGVGYRLGDPGPVDKTRARTSAR